MIRLEEILESKRAEIEENKRATPLSELKERIRVSDSPREFIKPVRGRRLSIIAEIKRTSPSQGMLAEEFDHRAIAREYALGGAAALSVLTDRRFFQGDPLFIAEVRNVCSLPVLRKDFILDEYQVYESRAFQADAILLIARALDPLLLSRFYQLAGSLGLAVIVEVHDEHDLAIANAMKAKIIGINNRDLSNYSVSLERSMNLRTKIHPAAVAISESGIRTVADVAMLSEAGFHGILIGGSLMRAENKRAFLNSLQGY